MQLNFFLKTKSMRTKINQKFTKKGDLFYSLIFLWQLNKRKLQVFYFYQLTSNKRPFIIQERWSVKLLRKKNFKASALFIMFILRNKSVNLLQNINSIWYYFNAFYLFYWWKMFRRFYFPLILLKHWNDFVFFKSLRFGCL